jgi:hypothetical protein
MNNDERTIICASCKNGRAHGSCCDAGKMMVCGNQGNKSFYKPVAAIDFGAGENIIQQPLTGSFSFDPNGNIKI